MTIYDKAKWHFEAVDQLGGQRDDAYAPAAYFFAWAAENGLLSRERTEQLAVDIEKLRRREIDGVRLLKVLDGVLASEDLSKDGDMFATSYFEYGAGLYMSDVRSRLPPGVTQELALGWRWAVYDELAPLITKRYEQWRSGTLPDAL